MTTSRFLCVANLSRFAQPVDLDLSKLEGHGSGGDARLRGIPDRSSASRTGSRWLLIVSCGSSFSRKPESAEAATAMSQNTCPLDVTAGWESILEGAGRERLGNRRPAGVSCRSSAGSRENPAKLKRTRIVDWAASWTRRIQRWRWSKCSSKPDRRMLYLLPLGDDVLATPAKNCAAPPPTAVIAPVASAKIPGCCTMAVFDDDTCARIAFADRERREATRAQRPIRGHARQGISRNSRIRAERRCRCGAARPSKATRRSSVRRSLHPEAIPPPGARHESGLRNRPVPHRENQLRPHSAIRRLDRVLARERIAEPTDALRCCKGLVPMKATAGSGPSRNSNATIEIVARRSRFPKMRARKLGDPLDLSEHPPSQLARDHVGIYLDSAATLGRRTAELHLALASPTDDPAFAPEPLDRATICKRMLADLQQHAAAGLRRAEGSRVRICPTKSSRLRPRCSAGAAGSWIISARLQISQLSSQRIRIHGDYHLGSGAARENRFRDSGFRRRAGAPAGLSPLQAIPAERCRGHAAFFQLCRVREPDQLHRAPSREILLVWSPGRSSGNDLRPRHFCAPTGRPRRAQDFCPPKPRTFEAARFFLLDKALYEVLYELNSSPGMGAHSVVGHHVALDIIVFAVRSPESDSTV